MHINKPGEKAKEKTQMTNALGAYKQFGGIRCSNIRWRPEFPKEKLYTFEVPRARKVDPEILARMTVSTRRVRDITAEIRGAPFTDWIVTKVDAGKNATAEE